MPETSKRWLHERLEFPATFWQWVDGGADDECWVWTAALNEAGYGIAVVDGRTRLAHRVAYELMIGSIPCGLGLDHVKERCGHVACVNPAHLEPVTHTENMRRASKTGKRGPIQRETCREGHPYTDENVYVDPKGRRSCKICRRIRHKLWCAKKKKEQLA